MRTTISGGGASDAAQDGWVLLLTAPDVVRAVSLPSAGAVVVGRDPTCDVALDHDRLSRRHARITVGPGFTVEDLGSRNGTQVGGVDVPRGRPSPVVPGEPITIGPFTAVVLARAVSAVRTAIGSSSILVEDPALSRPTALLVAVARSPVSVVIQGETGAGKEVLARALHALSDRRGPLVGINCAALAPQLLENELFGHEKGAFTGAVGKPGLLEAAARGTLLLDEVGDMPLELQAKLLRAIETREVLRVGAVAPTPVDVRFVAASHRELATACAEGQFRRDLYYRLAGITLTVPPLRERRAQIPPLAMRFAREATGRDDALTAAALARLGAHDWPGNARELRNVVERAALIAAGGPIAAEHLLFDPAAKAPGGAVRGEGEGQGDGDPERDRILAVLEECGGNQTHAARRLGISRATLVHRLDVYRVSRPRKGR